MPATVTLSDDGTYLIQHIIGQHTATMQRPVATALFARMVAAGVRRVFIDAREQHTPIGTMETYDLWERLAPRVPRGSRFAVVVGWPITGRPFIENVAVNRGVAIRYFNDTDEALSWLRAS